jgi:prolyl oligopeptidase
MLRSALHIFRISPFRGVRPNTRSISASATIMAPTPWTPGTYPATRRSDHVDIYKSASKGEVKVADPYQWLEEYSEETDNWTTAQQEYTRAYLDKNPDRQKLENVFRASMDYAKVFPAFSRTP